MNYRHIKNQKIAELIEINEKSKMVILKLEETGKPTSCTLSTFKRWWKKVDNTNADPDKLTDEEHVAQVMEQKKELGIECSSIDHVEVVCEDTCGDGTPLAEVGKEIAAQAKKKAAAAKKKGSRAKVDVAELYSKVKDVVEAAGFYIKQYDKEPKIIPVSTEEGGKKAFCNLYLGSKKCVLCMRISEVPDGYKADRIRNCPLGAAFDIDYNDLEKVIEIIKSRKVKEEK